MKTRHSNELLSALEDLIGQGFCVIKKIKLKRWYETQRITSGVFASILDKWHGELEQTVELLVAESDGDYLFIWGEHLEPKTGAWFKPLSSMTGKKNT